MKPVVTIIVRHGRDTYDGEPTQDHVSAWLNPLAAAEELTSLNAQAQTKQGWPHGSHYYTSFSVSVEDAP